MQRDSQKATKKTSTLLYVPNIIGYIRLGLLFISIWLNIRWFATLYSISYVLDALDGHMARYLKQESELGYILDMGVDRAASSVLMLQICKEHPHLFGIVGTCLALDIVAHMFCVVNRCVTKISHKSHNETGTGSAILKLYYTKPILFITCFGAEAFLLGILCFPKRYMLLGVCGLIFGFKQLTNILQFYKALHSLSVHV